MIEPIVEREPALNPKRVRRWINKLASLFALASPEPDPDAWYRAGTWMTCEQCGAAYVEHAIDPRDPWLNMLCNGDRVKT